MLLCSFVWSIDFEVAVKRSILFVLCLIGCGSGDTDSAPANGPDISPSPDATVLPLPTGTATYTGSLAKTVTTNGSDSFATYTEVQSFAGSIQLTANFETGLLAASISNPSSDFTRSSTQSSASNYNFTEESSYSGTVSGTGRLTGASFASDLIGNLIPTTIDRTPVINAQPEAFTGSLSGQVSGTNYTLATGTLSLGATSSGQTIPLLTDHAFTATRQ